MLSKNYLFILIASFFIAGFILLALPGSSYSQESWCCNNDSSNQCVQAPGGAGNCSGEALTFWPDPPAVPLSGETPQTGDLCPNSAGQRGPCQCTNPDDPTGDPIDCIDIPTGCCEFDDGGDMCNAPITDAACDALSGTLWEEDTPCDGNRCSDAGPVGCCIFQDQCSVTPENACDGDWTEGEECNVARTCGPIGCCQEEAAICSESNEIECEGEWTQGATCTSGSCDEMILGCCVFGPNDCGVISEEECLEERGDFEGPDAECSEVRICNIVISPIPTLNQWGLIAMAGLLGLFSLFIIIRRHRYNLS